MAEEIDLGNHPISVPHPSPTEIGGSSRVLYPSPTEAVANPLENPFQNDGSGSASTHSPDRPFARDFQNDGNGTSSMVSPNRPFASTSALPGSNGSSAPTTPPLTITEPTAPPANNATPGATGRAARRVQWVGLVDEDDEDDPTHHEPRRDSLVPEVSIPMPMWPVGSPNEQGGDDYFGPAAVTPKSSGAVTPDSSRPSTPDASMDIPEGETAGLPTTRSKASAFTKQAAKLVAVHKAKTGFLRGRENKRSRTRTRDSSTSRNGSVGDESEPEMSIPTGARGRATGTGVLSSLLKLYEQPPSLSSSGATLVNMTDDEDEHHHATPASFSIPVTDSPRQMSGRVPLPQTNHPSSSQAFANAHPHLHNPAHSREFAEAARRYGGRTVKAMDQGFRRVAGHLGVDMDDRPMAARSGAGVFGALQATTQNLSGVAAPAANRIAPSPSRPGYRLSRYSLPSLESKHMAAKDPPRAGSIDAGPNGIPHIALEQTATNSTGTTTATTATGATHPEQPQHPGHIQFLGGNHVHGGHAFGHTPRKNSSHLSLSGLSDLLTPSHYHHQSRVLKEKSVNTTPSGSATPIPEVFDEKGGRVRKRKKDKRRQEEIFITMHVAALLQRQDFILRLSRALMMFGAPTHRLESQIQATAKVLELQCQVIYLLNFMIISFQDEDCHTSDIKFIKQSSGSDLGKLIEIATLHWEVMHDKIGVQEASAEISRLMKAKPLYGPWQSILIGGLCSVCIGVASFGASLLDLLIAFPMGCALIAAQCFLASKSDILSNIFEICVTAVVSFAAAGLASTGYFCFSSIVSSSIVLILPGWLVCSAALELQSKAIMAGSVRLIWAVIYSLFLGFGISIGASFWSLVSGGKTLPNTSNCSYAHVEGVWWRTTISLWFGFLVVPGYSFGLALRNQTPIKCKEMLVMVLFACAGWTANHFAGIALPGRADFSSAIGSFAVGVLGNLWGKAFQGLSFVVALVPILFQLPSGLGNGGLLLFAQGSTTKMSTETTFSYGFAVAQQLIEVSIGLVVGLFLAAVVVYPFGKKRGGLFAF